MLYGAERQFETTFLGEPLFYTPNLRRRFCRQQRWLPASPVSQTFRRYLRTAGSLPLEMTYLGVARSTPRVEAEPHVFTCEFSGFSG